MFGLQKVSNFQLFAATIADASSLSFYRNSVGLFRSKLQFRFRSYGTNIELLEYN